MIVLVLICGLLYMLGSNSQGRTTEIGNSGEPEAGEQIADNVDGSSWRLRVIEYTSGTESKPDSEEELVLSFEEERFSLTTDCNALSGTYQQEGREVGFSLEESTEKACKENGFETELRVLLEKAQRIQLSNPGSNDQEEVLAVIVGPDSYKAVFDRI